MVVKVCKKCRTREGSPHKLGCVATRHPAFFTHEALYVAASDPGATWDTSSGSCDTGSSSDGSSGGGCD